MYSSHEFTVQAAENTNVAARPVFTDSSFHPVAFPSLMNPPSVRSCPLNRFIICK